MDYKDCVPLRTVECITWLIEEIVPEGACANKYILCTDPSFTVQQVIDYVKTHKLMRKFTIMTINVGLFELAGKFDYYTRDARKVNHNLEIVFP